MNLLNKIKKLFSASQHSSQDNLHDDFFSYIIDYYKDTTQYLLFYNKCLQTNSVKTNSEIYTSLDLKFGTSINEVKKRLSSKKFNISYNKSLNIKIILVRLRQNNHKIKCILHFFDSKLFMCNCTYSYLTKNEKIEIIKDLQDKYVPGLDYSSKQNIFDDHNNYLQVIDSVDLTINYLSADCDFFYKIKESVLLPG